MVSLYIVSQLCSHISRFLLLGTFFRFWYFVMTVYSHVLSVGANCVCSSTSTLCVPSQFQTYKTIAGDNDLMISAE